MIFTLLAALAIGAPAGPLLELPVRCRLGTECLVQKLPDHADGPGRQDFRCGSLTTDGHDGVDFRIARDDLFRAGVPILAAAAGRVVRTRDGEPDISIRERGETRGRDAGNGVVIEHGKGWETQYSHARRGSIRVRPGDTVTAGQQIAVAGLSGNTEYPHLHFTVRRNGAAVDPFTAEQIEAPCGSAAPETMWRNPVPYKPTALVEVGFASGVGSPTKPSREDLDVAIDSRRPLLMWADVIGARPGDEQRFAIVGPDGAALVDTRKVLERGGLTWFAFAGRLAPAGGWRRGVYRGRYELRRDGREILAAGTTTQVAEPPRAAREGSP